MMITHRCEWGWNHGLRLTGSCGVDGFRDAPLLPSPNPTLLCLRPPPLLCLSPALLIFLRLHSSRDSRHALPSPCLQSNASLPSPPPRHLHWNPPLPSPSVSLPACLPPSQAYFGKSYKGDTTSRTVHANRVPSIAVCTGMHYVRSIARCRDVYRTTW
ncbi:uncharacterized protein [Physcomitrium patens]|uniref:uncharacterized protein isoform X4 n=1 Tax=Physcomitrium patens TaxID=3218 RepID=UPI003CCE322E